METFCAAADLYCTFEHLEQRIDRSKVAGEVTDLAGAVELGRATWADIVGLDPGRRDLKSVIPTDAPLRSNPCPTDSGCDE